MSHEISYETYMCGQYTSDLESTIEELEEYKSNLETQIFALLCMDPSKIRNSRKRKGEDLEDSDYLNNAQYLCNLWSELKEEWENTVCKLSRCYDVKTAMERKTREIFVCPDCLREIDYENHRGEDGYYSEELTCPKCGKIFMTEDDSETSDKAKPMKIEINTWNEG